MNINKLEQWFPTCDLKGSKDGVSKKTEEEIENIGNFRRVEGIKRIKCCLI